MTKTKTATKTKSIHFEHTLGELERIVQQLEKGDLSLEESLKQFEKGIHLARLCQDTLSQAEQKISLLSGVEPQEPFTADE